MVGIVGGRLSFFAPRFSFSPLVFGRCPILGDIDVDAEIMTSFCPAMEEISALFVSPLRNWSPCVIWGLIRVEKVN